MITGYHSGRCWPPSTAIEDECPCPQEACGLVDPQRAHPDCEQHYFLDNPLKARSMRQGHPADQCPGAHDSSP